MLNHDGALSATVGHSPEPHERYQDAAGWCTDAAGWCTDAAGWCTDAAGWCTVAGYVPCGYAGGVTGIAALANDRGMTLGLWVGAGNAALESAVATAHPDWLATGNGRSRIVSHRNHWLCLGHEPAREHVLARLDRLVRDGVDWLLHDFETISRCDAARAAPQTAD